MSNEIMNIDFENENQNDSEEITEIDLISSIEEFEELSRREIEEQKKTLSKIREQTLLTTDVKKLEMMKKVSETTSNLQDILGDVGVLTDVKGSVKTAYDYKALVDAYAKMIDVQNKIKRLDSVNTEGVAGMTNLAIQFSDGNGNVTQIGIKTGGENG